MLNLRINIDSDSGFCFGVVYAIQMAEEMLQEQGYLYCLGDIVHNDAEVKRLEEKGLRIIGHEDLQKLQNEQVLIRAHGEPPSTYQTAMKNNLRLVDASCPVVLKLQNRIKQSFDREEHILIYGKQGHAEVQGLLGQTKESATVFQDVGELLLDELPEHITLYSQTTKSTSKLYQIKEELEKAGKTVHFNDTICRQVSNRDQELRTFASRYDCIVFVAGTKSSNGRVLYGVCQEVNPRSHFVSSPEQLQREWFEPNNSVGICGATSTPHWLMEEVQSVLSGW